MTMKLGFTQEPNLNKDANVTLNELPSSSNMSDNISANVSSNTIPIPNTSNTSQGVDISSISININEPSNQDNLVKQIESSMDVGMVSNLGIKRKTIVNNDKLTKRKKPIGSQCESKVESTATSSKVDIKSSVSNGPSTPTSASSFARNMIIPCFPFNSRYVHPPNTTTWGTGWEILMNHPKMKLLLRKSTFARIFREEKGIETQSLTLKGILSLGSLNSFHIKQNL